MALTSAEGGKRHTLERSFLQGEKQRTQNQTNNEET